MSDFLAEGLGLDTTFVPEYADALALVQLGITFPQGITLQTTTETTISQSDANTLVNAGVQFQGLFNVSFAKDSSITEAANLTTVSNLISAGLRPLHQMVKRSLFLALVAIHYIFVQRIGML